MIFSRNTAIIEFGDSHDECIYSQLRFLNQSKYRVFLISSEKIIKRINFVNEFEETKSLQFSGNFLKDINILFSIKKYLISKRIYFVIFNSANGLLVRNLSLILPKKIKQFGILHFVDKLWNSRSQRFITNRISKYFVINEYLKKYVPDKLKNKTECFYPIFFPRNKQIEIKKPENHLWIAIPGQIEFNKRDYSGLTKLLYKFRPEPTIKFFLLGNGRDYDGGTVRQIINENRLNRYFLTFDRYLENELFYSYLLKCDLIMPLIHPVIPRFENYMKYQISGNFNLSFGYKIPLFLHTSFANFDEFKKASFFYNEDNFAEILNTILKDISLITKKSEEIKSEKKYDFEYQRINYIRTIENN
ncbi:MAG: hypothetical protein FJ216_09250 [Ignavibacteria bacterium]|nr:hypothetical protein [Ignavibacteria bacterium]